MAKTTCERTVEALPWWLTGALEEAETESVERHLAECPACSDEVAATRGALALYALHLPVETLLDRVEDASRSAYRTAAGDLLSRQAVEAHLDHCPSCREEIGLLTASRAAIDADSSAPGATVTAFAPQPRRRSRGGRLDRRSLALAASLVLFAVAAGGWFLTGRVAEDRGDRLAELERRVAAASGAAATAPGPAQDAGDDAAAALAAEAALLAERVAELEAEVEEAREASRTPRRLAEAVAVGPTFSWRLRDPVLRGGADPAAAGVTVPAGAEDVSLFVEEVGEGPLRLVIEDAAGRLLVEREGLRPYDHPLLGRHLTVTLPVADLPAGALRLRLYGGGREVGSLVLRVGG